MLSLPPSVRIFASTLPTDMRKSFDGLVGLVETVIKQSPTSGHLFLFINRNRDRLKILYWDRDGLAIFYKRLEQGTFQMPRPKDDNRSRNSNNAETNKPAQQCLEIRADELAMLLGGIDLRSVRRRKRYSLAS